MKYFILAVCVAIAVFHVTGAEQNAVALRFGDSLVNGLISVTTPSDQTCSDPPTPLEIILKGSLLLIGSIFVAAAPFTAILVFMVPSFVYILSLIPEFFAE